MITSSASMVYYADPLAGRPSWQSKLLYVLCTVILIDFLMPVLTQQPMIWGDPTSASDFSQSRHTAQSESWKHGCICIS